jgi:hypothetical protein
MSRPRRLWALGLLLLLVAACTSSGDPHGKGDPVPTSSTSATPVIGKPGTLCDFVPRTPLTDVLGTAAVTASGTVNNGTLGWLGSCIVKVAGDQPAAEITFEQAGSQAAGIRRETEQHTGDWFVYPAGDGVGWAHPEFSTTVGGTKVTGAITTLLRGDFFVVVKLYRPKPGADAVAGAVSVARSIMSSLELPAS